jgi:hypothetical protein
MRVYLGVDKGASNAVSENLVRRYDTDNKRLSACTSQFD